MLLNTLYYLYKNRWRQIAYGDASQGWMLAILYAFALLSLYRNKGEYTVYYALVVLFSQIIYFHTDRKDYNLLLRFYGKARMRLLLFADYFILNFPLLLIIFLKNKFLVLPAITVLLLFTFLQKISFQKNNFIRLPLSVADPLWKTGFRKAPIIVFALLLLGYYVCLEGILNKNFKLAAISYFMVAFIGWMINGERDKLVFIKQSRLSTRKYLLNSMKANISHTLLLLLPYFIIGLYGWHFAFWAAFQAIIFIFIAVCLRYIIFSNLLLFSLTALLFFVLSLSSAVSIYSLSNSAIFLIAFSSLFIAFIAFLLAEKSIEKLRSE